MALPMVDNFKIQTDVYFAAKKMNTKTAINKIPFSLLCIELSQIHWSKSEVTPARLQLKH